MPTPRAGYHLADGTKVPGVTTILGRWKESGGLLQWAFKQGQSGARSLYEERDRAADIGTMAHAMAEEHMRGNDPDAALDAFKPDADAATKARQAFGSFRKWADGQRGMLVSAEEPLVSEVHRFGGTPDFVIRTPEGLAMGDIKTSNGIYRDHLMQVAAYGIVWNETHPDDPIVAGFHVARFSKDFPDFEHRYFAELEGAARLFVVLRDAYALDLELKRRCA